ncbi:cupredoxin domain-containing protein [Streptomyces sp. NRRL F-5126]|uniref:cupredoxin domain-containing protein n=1 Tax=Streptomyces sp. NRRL F-5126 TaxID=1463857 RepID=UPI0004C65B30|nr:cupredoxin domain-containing protein [Streptomyces sp. NRRL F-5126]
MPFPTRTGAAAASCALGVLALAGCSGGGNGSSGNSSARASANASPSSPAASSAASSAPAAGKATITIDNFHFKPPKLTVRAGSTVTVTNKDSTDHTVTATGSGSFDTGHIAPGATKTFKAPAKAGSYPYDCSIHPFMKGTLTVS